MARPRDRGRKYALALPGSRKRPAHWCSQLLLSVLLSGVASASTTVYRSIGDDGVVVFSDEPPATNVEVDVLHITVSTGGVDADEKLRELRATNDRMARARREREAARAQAPGPVIRYTVDSDEPVNVILQPPAARQPLWPYMLPARRYRGPLRHHPSPGPVSPAAIPPGFQVIQPGNAQLMRPVVSSRE